MKLNNFLKLMENNKDNCKIFIFSNKFTNYDNFNNDFIDKFMKDNNLLCNQKFKLVKEKAYLILSFRLNDLNIKNIDDSLKNKSVKEFYVENSYDEYKYLKDSTDDNNYNIEAIYNFKSNNEFIINILI